MDGIKKVMGEIPQSIQKHGTPTEKLQAIWVAIGHDRDVCQSHLGVEMAKRWADYHLSPNIPTHDERRACERIRKMLCRETPLHFDFALEAFIPCLPEPYQSAALALIMPTNSAKALADPSVTAWEANARADNLTDRIRNDVAFHGLDNCSAEELKLMDRAYANEQDSIVAVRAAIQSHMEKIGARAPSNVESISA